MEKAKVFLSFNSKDGDFPKKLSDHLSNHNIDAWCNSGRIGNPVVNEIEAGINNSNAFIFCIGDSGAAEWQERERNLAEIRRNRPGTEKDAYPFIVIDRRTKRNDPGAPFTFSDTYVAMRLAPDESDDAFISRIVNEVAMRCRPLTTQLVIDPPTKNHTTSPLPRHLSTLAGQSQQDFDTTLRLYSDLFARIGDYNLSATDDSEPTASLLVRLWNSIRDGRSSQSAFCSIVGPIGTGKTTLMALLTLLAMRQREVNRDICVDYVNFHELDEIAIKTDENHDQYRQRIREAMQERFDSVRRILCTNTRCQAYLFADGFEDYKRDRFPDLQTDYLSFVRSLQGISVVCSIGTQHTKDNPFRRGQQNIDIGKNLASLKPLKTNNIETCEVAKAFLRVYRMPPGQSILIDDDRNVRRIFIERSQGPSGRHLDLLKMMILVVTFLKPELQKHHANTQSFTSALAAYVEHQIGEHSSKIDARDRDMELRRIAWHVFHEDLPDSTKPDELARFQVIAWSDLTAHPAIRSYLRAFHVIIGLVDIANQIQGTQTENWHSAGFLLPDEDNSHCKWLMNDGNGNQRASDKVFMAIEKIVKGSINELSQQNGRRIGEEGVSDLVFLKQLEIGRDFTHLIYLLGRFSKHHREEALSVLRDLAPVFFCNPDGAIDSEARFRQYHDDHNIALRRLRSVQFTLLISLINIDDAQRENYCNLFLRYLGYEKWRRTVCTFHLNYYGDEPFFDPLVVRYPPNKENAGYSETLDKVGTRVRASLGSVAEIDPLLQVEIATLCSLAISRKVTTDGRMPHFLVNSDDTLAGCLSDTLELISNIKLPERLSPPVQHLCDLTRRLLSIEDTFFYSQGFVVKILENKYSTLRSGWVLFLGLTTPIGTELKMESAGAHSWGAMMLAEMVLPDFPPSALSPSEKQIYNKNEILRCLLVHEVGESVIGDYTISTSDATKSEEIKNREATWVEKFSMLGIMPHWPTQAGILDRFKDYTYFKTVNGRIAKTVDKIDTLIQLVVFKKRNGLSNSELYGDRKKPVQQWFELFCKDLEAASHGCAFTAQLALTWSTWARFEWSRDGIEFQYEDLFKDTKRMDARDYLQL